MSDLMDCLIEAADCGRLVAEDLGTRRHRVYLVTTEWSGESRGRGIESVKSVVELSPRPRIEGWEGIILDVQRGGRIEVGSIKAVVSARYTSAELLPSVGLREDFFWEVVGPDGERRRFFPATVIEPETAATSIRVLLTRVMDDRGLDGAVPDMKRIFAPVKI